MGDCNNFVFLLISYFFCFLVIFILVLAGSNEIDPCSREAMKGRCGGEEKSSWEWQRSRWRKRAWIVRGLAVW